MKQVKKIIKILVLIMLLSVSIYCFYNFIGIKKELNDIVIDQEEIIEIADIPEETTEESKINFEELKKINPDIIAWIFIEGTNINYPILQNNSNTYYLKHNYKKEYSNGGSIYMDATANSDFSSMNTFIYGHYTSNGTMFGELGKFMNQKFFDVHKDIIIYTPTKNYKLEIFSVHVDNANSSSYKMSFSSKEDYIEYVNLMKSKSNVNSEVNLDLDKDKIVTLYSCSRETNYKKQDRYYVHGVLSEIS